MPIRINLLAEAQAQEEQRRKDPIKRAIWIGAFLVFCVLLWSSTIQIKAMSSHGEFHRWQTEIAARSNAYQVVLASKNRLDDQMDKLHMLRKLAFARFLNGSTLNALEQSTIDDVELVRFRVSQQYELTDAIKGKTGGGGVTPGKPATATEKIIISLDARDVGANPGDQINHYKQALADNPYFQAVLGKTNEVRLTNFSPPQTGADNKSFVLFTLECRLPEKTR
jgi:hypothetical protein